MGSTCESVTSGVNLSVSRYAGCSSLCPDARTPRLLPSDDSEADVPLDHALLVDDLPDDRPPYTGLQDCRGQGKVAELRQELNSGGKRDKNHSAKKITLKKIVANMTMSNNDMVALFPDVVDCMQIPSLEIKKMYVRM